MPRTGESEASRKRRMMKKVGSQLGKDYRAQERATRSGLSYLDNPTPRNLRKTEYRQKVARSEAKKSDRVIKSSLGDKYYTEDLYKAYKRYGKKR